eukprot:jgi/Ulvmu1/7288/UM035_0076.1
MASCTPGSVSKDVLGQDAIKAPLESLPVMMKNLWTARARQQTPVDVAADQWSWPLGQKLVCPLPTVARNESCDRCSSDGADTLKQSRLPEQGYFVDRYGLRKESLFLNHRLVMDAQRQGRVPGVAQAQYRAFRQAAWIPESSNFDVATAGLHQDTVRWNAAKRGAFGKSPRYTMQNLMQSEQLCRVDHYNVHESIPKRSIMSNIRHNKFGSKMPVRSQRNTSLVTGSTSDPDPGSYNPFPSRRRCSQLVTPAAQYRAWQHSLNSSDSAQRALVHRYSAVATGAHIGKAFKEAGLHRKDLNS